jgi:hypothetical protein
MANSSLGLSRNVTPNDGTSLPEFNMFMVVTTAGDVSVEFASGQNHTISSVPIGVWMPCGDAVKIRDTGTTAVGIIVV